jgi:uncharacterized membrane protein YeaQ/YmgE (transglycosylase-associated protein family)
MFQLAIIVTHGFAVAMFVRWLAPHSGPGGWGLSALLGMAGSMLGVLVGQWSRVPAPVSYLLSLLGAVAFVAFHHTLTATRPGWT